ncbi:hypothetical protein SAMN06272775_6012 [Streptomyces sp. 2323.1]|uniref:hypothetical protein n=1 Tax=Streptomyces sp. 2323.1 TaxID=1938841 RepID=UPI000BB6C427|nr:hypothetical protein [Streptomyces sp. 2323.1]SOE15081.1 hypothetical protein SAMN06272775_6012 [Streptomyces sp. 2323.1]
MANLHLPRPDYRIDGLKATTEQTEEDFSSVTLSDDMFLPLVEHHSADGRDSYLLMYDWAAIWDVPGTAEYVALHISRGHEHRTFDFASETHPTVPLAQNWLVRRGCPDEAAELSNIHWPRPADALTSHLEEQLRANQDDRYTVIDHHTRHQGPSGFGVEVQILLHDTAPDSASTPYRLFLEETTDDFRSYTVREGAFATADAAHEWARDRSCALPIAPSSLPSDVRLARAARSRSSVASDAGPPAVSLPGAPHRTAAAPARVRRSVS